MYFPRRVRQTRLAGAYTQCNSESRCRHWQVNITPIQNSVSFNDAKRNLKNSEALSLNQYQNETKVLFIQGGNVDASGNAERWVFGISKGDIN